MGEAMKVEVNMTIREPRTHEVNVELDLDAFDYLDDEDERHEAAREAAIEQAVEEAKDDGVLVGADEELHSIDSIYVDGEEEPVPSHLAAD